MTVERAAFATDTAVVLAFLRSICDTTNLGANDIYRWSGFSTVLLTIPSVLIVSRYLASHQATTPSANNLEPSPPDLKLNLIYPCTAAHIKKYSAQRVRMVTETPEIYATHIRPYMLRQREEGRLNWVFNIIQGRTEQEDVILRDHGGGGNGNNGEGFLLLPDLNWDRKTMTSLHLLALVERRDIWSLRDLTKGHVRWLKRMREHVLEATTKVYPGIEEDELKLYVHCEWSWFFPIKIIIDVLRTS
jgi:m7GpppX diphosphatase